MAFFGGNTESVGRATLVTLTLGQTLKPSAEKPDGVFSRDRRASSLQIRRPVEHDRQGRRGFTPHIGVDQEALAIGGDVIAE
jgi:hypothetical protein